MADFELVRGTSEELYDVINSSEYEDIYLEIHGGTYKALFVKQDYNYIRDALDKMSYEAVISWYINDEPNLVISFD